MMKVFVASLVACVSTTSIHPAMADDNNGQQIRFATEGVYPPYNFTEGGKLVGLEIDLINDLCERMKAHCTISTQAFDGLIPALNAGKFDVIMSGMNATSKRREVIEFTRPYIVETNGFAAAKGSALASLPEKGKKLNLSTDASPVIEQNIARMKEALKGTTLGVQSSTADATFADRYLKDVATIKEYKSSEESDLDLAAGRIDAELDGTSKINAMLQKPGYEQFAHAGPLIVGGVFGDGFSAGIRKQDVALRTMLDKAITSAIADGSIKRLSEKWLHSDISPTL